MELVDLFAEGSVNLVIADFGNILLMPKLQPKLKVFKGFSLLKADTSSGYVTVQGIDWKKFELVLRLVRVDAKWLVDGAGIINIPIEKRARR